MGVPLERPERPQRDLAALAWRMLRAVGEGGGDAPRMAPTRETELDRQAIQRRAHDLLAVCKVEGRWDFGFDSAMAQARADWLELRLQEATATGDLPF